MKDFIQIWNRVSGKTYASVNQHDREMRDLSNNRLRPADIDTSAFEANFDECEGLNSKLEEASDFSGRKDAIINRLFEKRKQGQVARHPKDLFILLMLGFFGIAAGCFILFVHPYDILFKLKVVLAEGGEIYEMWRKPEVQLYTRIYLFNVTNADDFMEGRADKLHLKEVGPYVYRENLEHKNVTFNDNGTLSAVPVHPLTWVEELSEGNRETDTLVLPNIALLDSTTVLKIIALCQTKHIEVDDIAHYTTSIAHVVSKHPNYITRTTSRLALNAHIAVTRTKPLLEMTAREFMFGYESSLVTLGNTFLPGWIKFDKLGLIDRMYDFEGDYETVYTGEDDVETSGLLDTYRGSPQLPQWSGACADVRQASDGTKFRGGVPRNGSMLFYRKSLCRAAPLVSVDEGVKSGLHGYLYTFPDDMLDNGKSNVNNKCFCRDGQHHRPKDDHVVPSETVDECERHRELHNRNCLPDGLIDVTDCYYGFPIALSYPHFYKAEERLFKHVEGLSPSKEKHQTRFWIQPESGLPLDVSTKFQINMALDDLSSITNSERFSNVYLPLLWFDIRMFELPKSMAERFKLYLNVLPVVEQSAMYILFLVGAALVLIAVYRLAFKVMFKSFDHTKKHNNIILGTELWSCNERKGSKRNQKEDLAKSGVYAPCEIPLNDDDDSEDNIVRIETERRSSGFIKTHSDRIKELGNKLNDKVYDSVGSIKDKIKEIPHVKNIFENEARRGSLITPADNYNVNDGFKSDDDDSDDAPKSSYQMVNMSDSDDECKYLEVIDDGSQFDDMMTPNLIDRRKSKDIDIKIQRMNELDGNSDEGDDDLIISLSDLRIDV